MGPAVRHVHPFGAAAAALVMAVILGGCSSSPRPRNLLIISLDTMRADRLPAYGFSGIATPALDRLAAEGAVFEEAFAAVPLTLPSHASLFTGLYPGRLGVRDNAGAPLGAEFQTLAEIMGARGLRTGAFVASAVLAPGRGLDQGFETYSAGPANSCLDAPRARRSADAVVDDALNWLARGASNPFFAWIHLFDTHRPYRLPPDYAHDNANPYLAAIAFEDTQIARIVAQLASSGALDETLIVVAGDHGESLGDHGEEGHGIFIYQETLRVPLVVRGPGITARRIPGPVRLLDVMPTVLEMFDAPVPGLDGASLVPLLNGVAEHGGREVYAESLYPERFGWARLRSLRADRYKVIDAPRPELYDLEKDPFEEQNLFEARPAIAAAMLARLRSMDGQHPAGPAPPAVGRALAGRLASLGYVSGTSAGPATATTLPDPKDTIAMFNQLTRMQAAGRAVRSSECRDVEGSGK